ncbi:MAG TPA: NotI family restriction endonuclease [Phototrophicaceae bacterium]|nr:NotI family restriction endonuclease [Phototrophicaceae bacterium]
MTDRILELFSVPTGQVAVDWNSIIQQQYCPFLSRKCLKIRKSQPERSIGTCSVSYGVKTQQKVIICPYRFLERQQIFLDCLHLLTLHEPGNELHKIAEVEIPGGSVDYFLVSARNHKIVDFVGIELQAVDTTGTIWPERQQFLRSVGVEVEQDFDLDKGYGMNWKMTAKTTLVQLHHKVETFEQLKKHFVLVLQENLLNYMQREFNFSHIQAARLGDTMHFHAYGLQFDNHEYRLGLASRSSTDAAGITTALGLQVSANVELEVILETLQRKLSSSNLLII